MPVFIQGPALKWEIHEYVSHLHNTFTDIYYLTVIFASQSIGSIYFQDNTGI